MSRNTLEPKSVAPSLTVGFLPLRRDGTAFSTSQIDEMKLQFFKTPEHFRKWLEKKHSSVSELWDGFDKKATGHASITWPESVDQALCFGWIDGIRKSVDEISYTLRFTPRRHGSIWSAVNIKRATELSKLGLMLPSGIEAFSRRKEYKSGIYAYEQRSAVLEPPFEKKLKQNKRAWDFFYSQPAWYRKQVSWWLLCAKKEETKLKRLERLIKESEEKRRV